MSKIYSNCLPVCQVCNLKSLCDIPVAKLKGTIIKDNLIYCGSCWCKKHNGPKPEYNTFCLICYPEKRKVSKKYF